MTRLETDFAPALHVIAVLAESQTIDVIARTLENAGDELSVATDLAEGLARTASEAPDVVLIDITMGRNAGLAVIHHARAIAPNAAVYALAPANALELATQAVALGGSGVIMMPLSGDELLMALADVRTRRAERHARERWEHEAQLSRRGESLVARVAEIAEAHTRREAAEHLTSVLATESGARTVLVYLPAGEGSRQLMRAAMFGQSEGAPTFCDEMELNDFCNEHRLEVVRLALRKEQSGFVLLGGVSRHEPVPLVGLVAMQAATALALIAEREQSTRSAMKDPSSSAYTFSYFVDVAGREIDKARRHGRRFALATLGIEDASVDSLALTRRSRAADIAPSSAAESRREPSVEAAERVLSVVRDTDVLARVDESEFYLLLPETGGMGAHTCRRRVMRQLTGPGGFRRGNDEALDVVMGVATFPHDGSDLSQLLRVAKHRAEMSRRSVVRRLGLDRLPLGEIVDALFWATGARNQASGIDQPREIELPAMDLVGLAVGAASEAVRGGAARIVAVQRSGVSIGAAVRSALGRDREDVRFDAVDLGDAPGCGEIEALALVAEHGAYALIGKSEHGVVHALHLADPVFVDLLVLRMGEAAGVRLID
jgi:GGDEF domain-containing protein/DNA-binding response OmpR family regulator